MLNYLAKTKEITKSIAGEKDDKRWFVTENKENTKYQNSLAWKSKCLFNKVWFVTTASLKPSSSSYSTC